MTHELKTFLKRAILIVLFLASAVALLYFKDDILKDHFSNNQSRRAAAQSPPAFLAGYFVPIRERLREVGLEELGTKDLPVGAEEFRFWVGFSVDDSRCLILRNNRGEWSASQITTEMRTLDAPLNGWQQLISRVTDLGLYQLPGIQDETDERREMVDAVTAIVETRISGEYKVVRYRGMFYFKDDEMVKMEKILQVLTSELHVKTY